MTKMLNILLHTKVLTSRKDTPPKTATYMNRQFIKESQVCVDRWIYIFGQVSTLTSNLKKLQNFQVK